LLAVVVAATVPSGRGAPGAVGFLSAEAQYRDQGRTRKTSRLELAIKRHVAAALNGDVGSAAMLLKMRAHGLKLGDTGPTIIRIVNSLPPFPYGVDDEEGS
jgi:hypothetical protein